MQKVPFVLDSGRAETVCLPLFSQGYCILLLDKNTLILIKALILIHHSFGPKRDLTILFKVERCLKNFFQCLRIFFLWSKVNSACFYQQCIEKALCNLEVYHDWGPSISDWEKWTIRIIAVNQLNFKNTICVAVSSYPASTWRKHLVDFKLDKNKIY